MPSISRIKMYRVSTDSIIGHNKKLAWSSSFNRKYYFSLEDLFIVSSAYSWWERGTVFKSRPRSHYSSCLIFAILSPSSSVIIFTCPLFSVKELPRPSPIVLLSPTSLLLTASLQYASSCVSQPLWKRKLFKIRKNNFANMFSFVQH